MCKVGASGAAKTQGQPGSSQDRGPRLPALRRTLHPARHLLLCEDGQTPLHPPPPCAGATPDRRGNSRAEAAGRAFFPPDLQKPLCGAGQDPSSMQRFKWLHKTSCRPSFRGASRTWHLGRGPCSPKQALPGSPGCLHGRRQSGRQHDLGHTAADPQTQASGTAPLGQWGGGAVRVVEMMWGGAGAVGGRCWQWEQCGAVGVPLGGGRGRCGQWGQCRRCCREGLPAWGACADSRQETWVPRGPESMCPPEGC